MNIDSRLKELKFVPANSCDSTAAQNTARIINRIPAKLPDDFLRFLSTYGGGDFDEEVECLGSEPPPQSENGATIVDQFFGTGSGESSLETWWKRGSELLAEQLFPIASAPGGDLYCLRKSETTDIVFWDHDSGNTYRAADSFTDFVFRLRLSETDKLDLSNVKVTLDPDLL